MEPSGNGAEDQSDSGPSPNRSNPFDLANILGSSPFTGSLSSAATIYPPLTHIPSAFSMLEPHPMFPGAALLPFGGLGSLGEGLMSAGVLGHSIGSATNGADWWRAASEQASRQMTSDSMGPSAFYAGLNGTFGSPLFSPLFSPGISSAAVTTPSCSSSVNKSSSLATSSSKSGTSKSHKQSISSPIPKDSKDSRSRKEQRTEMERGAVGNQENSSLLSPSRSSGKIGTTIDGSADALAKNSSSQLDYSLESSLLSAEAALYSASPFFFPFGAMAALSSAFGGMPFPGSSAMYSCPTTSPAYTSPFTIFPSHSSSSTSKMSATESPVSQKSKSESRTWTPVSRMSSSGTTSSTPGASTPGANTPVSPGTPHRSRGMAISPCETGRKSGGDHKKESLGTATSVIVSRVGSSPSAGSSARTLSISDHKMHLSGKTESLEADEKNRSHLISPQKMAESKLRSIATPDNLLCNNSRLGKGNEKHSTTSGTNMFNDSALYSLDGAIDLSIKKPRTESPGRVPTTPTKSHMLSKSSEYHRNSAAPGSLVSSSQADVLSALAHSHQVYAEHQAQLLANNQMAAAAAAAGLADPLSFNLAAAALLPQMYDGMTGFFYPPSALAAMAAASGVMSNVSPKEKMKGGRGRGRRRGLSGQQSSSRNRGRGSSLFISSMMQMSKKPEENQEKGGKSRGGGDQGVSMAEGGSAGKSRVKGGKVRTLPGPVSYLDSEEQRHQQDLLCQHMESEMQQQQHHHQLKLLQKMQHKKEASLSGASADSGSGGSSSLKGHQGRRETLTSKLQHHQSKLAQALMGQDGLTTTSPALLGSPLFKKADLTLDQQLTSTEYDSSVRTDSDLDDESSSSECSGSESGSEGESQSTQGSEGGNSMQSASGNKRKLENTDGSSGRKRRRTILDETEIRVPLELHEWQRETRIRSFTPKKIIGEVVYVTPCGKKLRNYYEVEKYLEKNEIKDLSRDNFTFTTKVNLGKFFELNSGETPGYVQLTESEVNERYLAIEARKKRIVEKRLHVEQCEERRRETEELTVKMTEAKIQKKFEQQELAKRVAEVKLKKRAERQQQKEMLHRARQLRAMELRKSKEKQKMIRQQEKFNRQQQIKLEREVRSQQMIEEKEVKRQQSVMLKEQERERRRQQVLLVKAMEARKKEEEKERLKEEKKSAKKLDREKKLEQKRLELFMAREQKKPMEDMCIVDGKTLPELERIYGVTLAGKAFADCLMVLEFVHNFSGSLGFDIDSLPTMRILQCGLMNEEECSEDFMSFVSHLVKFVLEDPGMANPKEAVSQSGQKLIDIDITDDNISELLRIFIRSRNGKDDEMTEWLKTKPFQSLNPTQKAAILAYLCNELLSSKSVTGEIEKNIDGINNLRRDKWIVEGKLRKLRMLQAKRFRKVILKGQQSEDSNTTTTNATTFNSKKDTDEEAEESGNDSDEAPPHVDGAHDSDAEEDQTISSEELDGKIEKLIKQQNQLREKIFNVAHKLSAVSFGQDRYRRRYWILPKCGGIFVEGLESAEPEIFEAMKEGEEMMMLLPEGQVNQNPEGEKVEEEKLPEQSTGMPAEDKEKDGDSVLEAIALESMLFTAMNEEVKKLSPEGGSSESTEPDATPHACPTEILNGSLTEELSTPVTAAVSAVSAVASPSMVTVSAASVPATTSSETERYQTSTTTSCCLGKQSNIFIQNLSDIVSHTVMNSLGQSPGREDADANSSYDYGFHAQTKNEIKVKKEAEMQPGLTELFDINYRLKVEPKPFQMDSFMSEEKMVIKSEAKHLAEAENVIDGFGSNVKLSQLSFTKSETVLENENSSVVTQADAVITKSEVETHAAGTTKTEGNFSFAALCSNLLPCSTSATSPSAVTASLSLFRSIDSILQPDLKTKPNNLFAAPAGSCNPSSTASYFVPPSMSAGEVARWNINRSIQNGTWFSILPRVPCDASTLKPTSCPPPSLPPLTPDLLGAGAPRPAFSGTPGSTITTCLTPTLNKLEISTDDLLTTPGDLDMQSDYAVPHQDAPRIPPVYRRGWWKISNPDQIKQLLSCLNLRGIRERNLQKALEKHLDFVCLSNSKTKKNVIKLEVTAEGESKCNSSSSSGLGCSNTAPTPAPCPDDKDDWNRQLQRKMEIKVLEDIESMEERVCHASLQVKERKSGGWKMSPRVTTNHSVELVSSYEKDLKPNQRYILDASRSRLLFLEHNIERRYLKPPLGRSTQLNLANISTTSSKDNVSSSDDDSDADEETATKELALWRSAVALATSSAQLCLYTMQLNKCIAWEKSIMKVSCQICCCDDNEAELLLCDICDRGYHTYCVKPKIESIPEGDWYCYECISKASGDTCCVVCGRHGNRLATCEFCRRRAHIDCLDPPLARMPKKWSCNSCAVEKGKMKKKQSRPVSAASSTSTPMSSTPVKDTEKELNGIDKIPELEEKLTMIEEIKLQDEDTLQSTPPNSLSSEKSTKSARQKNEKNREKSDTKNKITDEEEVVEKETTPVCNGSNISEEDASICWIILEEMKKHPDAWPFLNPVNAKQFPTYRKVIRSPIDFKTMGRKLRSNIYKTLDEFAADARLVFNNCELFNEDDSSVGRAGHSMKLFFERRWSELTANQ